MKTASKLVVFMGFTGVGLYCCSQVFVSGKSGATARSVPSQWTTVDDSLAVTRQLSAFDDDDSEAGQGAARRMMIGSTNPDQTEFRKEIPDAVSSPDVSGRSDESVAMIDPDSQPVLETQSIEQGIRPAGSVDFALASLPPLAAEELGDDRLPSELDSDQGNLEPVSEPVDGHARISNPFAKDQAAGSQQAEFASYSNSNEKMSEVADDSSVDEQRQPPVSMLDSILQDQKATSSRVPSEMAPSNFRNLSPSHPEAYSQEVASQSHAGDPMFRLPEVNTLQARSIKQPNEPRRTKTPQAFENNTSRPSRPSAIVEQRAREHTEYGKSLARRGAVFAARQEFIQALRLIAESHDMSAGTREYTSRLANGLRALTESDDFVASDSEQQLQMDVRSILLAHSVQLISPESAANISPIHAMQIYYAYAADQLSLALGQSDAASDTLHSLGKLLTTASQYDSSGKPMDRTKAMVMHQVALSANPSNHLSANELGVLMAGNGRWNEAADLFAESLKARPTAATWQNLANIHRQLAANTSDNRVRARQNELAQLAMRESSLLSSGSADLNVAAILPETWSTAQSFEGGAAMPEYSPSLNHAAPAGGNQQARPVVAEKPTRKRFLNRVKDLF